MGDFTWANAIALATLLFVGLSALLGVWWQIEQRIRRVEDKAKHDLRNVEQVAAEKRSKLERELQDFRLHVAEKYASYETVKEDQRVLADQIKSLADTVSKMPDVVVERITKYLSIRTA
jgi:4-alpha-glucanotransferase